MKRAFTLIELLAVIIILAIVTVIAVPIINNAIDDSRESANLRSIEGYARAVEQKYYEEMSDGVPVIDSNFLASINTGGGKVTCNSVNFSAEYNVVLNSCTVENTKDKTYCYANGKHYECNDTEFSNILSQLGS